jgi:hypothetical protein
MPTLTARLVGGPTAILEYAGLRWLTDPTLSLAGAVQVPRRFDGAYLTLSSDRAAAAARILGARAVVPLHFEGWTHFTQGADALRAAFAGYGISDKLLLAEREEIVAV